MADYANINGVAAASIAKVNGVSYADIAKCNGLDTPSLGATRWVIASENGYIAHATNADRTSWTAYDSTDGTDPGPDNDADGIGFGRNSSGVGIYVATRNASARELTVSGTDVTSTSTWTNVDLEGSENERIMEVLWGARSNGAVAGVWVAVGDPNGPGSDSHIYRSTDGGANWSSVELSGLTDHATGEFINGVATDGTGKWMFALDDRIYYSTDDAASFAVSTPFAGMEDIPTRVQNIVFTNNSWVLCYNSNTDGSGAVYFRSCASSDITDWTATAIGGRHTATDMTNHTSNGLNVKMAAAAGRVCAISEGDDDLNFFDVNGKTISNLTKVDISMGGDKAKDIATDGSTWMIVCTDGDIHESTDNGASWTQTVDGLQVDGSNTLDLESVTCDVVLPL
jgi:hypothetical protein